LQEIGKLASEYLFLIQAPLNWSGPAFRMVKEKGLSFVERVCAADFVISKPGYGQFLRIMEECRHQRPVMPAQAFYMSALNRAVEYAIYGRMTPRQALKQAARETQAELDLRLAGR